MIHLIRSTAVVLLLTGGRVATLSASAAVDSLLFEPSWQLPAYEQVREQTMEWIDSREAEEEVKQEALGLWPSVDLRDGDGAALLDRLAKTFALFDERVQQLLETCNEPLYAPRVPKADWLQDAGVPDFKRSNLKLYLGRWLAQYEFYDEALHELSGLQVGEVVDPAGLLFYRMVAHHQLVHPDKSRAELVRLLELEERLPRRYRQVAKLINVDIAGLEDESLDHIARRMNDVRRRLNLGDASEQVQDIEKGVVESLDEIIEKLQQQQQQQASSASGSAQSSRPMEDSRLPSMKAPGRVDPRDIGHQSGWGDLPPKEREEALQQIGRDFPVHYRQLIEQYFRDLANEPAPDQPK